MKKISQLLAVIVGLILAGCAASNQNLLGQRNDVFQVVSSGVSGRADEAVVTVSASIKTHKYSALLFEPSKHGKEEYLLYVDINGQSMGLPMEMQNETTATDPHTDPESGEGVRYLYKTTIRLKPGTYTVTAYLPTEDVSVRREVVIPIEGKTIIIIKPTYRGLARRKAASLRWRPDFKDGVKGLDIMAE
ncbi:MAG: hypothetical protein ACYDIB_06425 [Desulfobulbia bacterium]